MPAYGKRRALGQHFLKDRMICNLIAQTAVEQAHLHGCVALLEIGPGKGAITEPLLGLLKRQKQIESFQLVERDRDLAAFWKSRLSSQDESLPSISLMTLEADFVELPATEWLKSSPIAVVSNLPYSAGTAITTGLARHTREIPVMVLMFQAEVAQRLRAEPSTKSWGSLSVWIQNQWEVKKLTSVPPRAFSPPPEVDSEVVVFTRRDRPLVHVENTPAAQAQWESLLKACFAHRRKMLRAGLAGTPFKAALDRSGIDPTLRAEALSWEHWAAFWQSVNSNSPEKQD